MNSIQYTIRSIPVKVDQALRRRARRSGKSLNTVVVEVLTGVAGINEGTETFHDLDWFVGALALDPGFDDAMDWLDSLPQED